ncbi:hypothetical protein DKG75_13845, partial [Zavarzinia compransoris]
MQSETAALNAARDEFDRQRNEQYADLQEHLAAAEGAWQENEYALRGRIEAQERNFAALHADYQSVANMEAAGRAREAALLDQVQQLKHDIAAASAEHEAKQADIIAAGAEAAERLSGQIAALELSHAGHVADLEARLAMAGTAKAEVEQHFATRVAEFEEHLAKTGAAHDASIAALEAQKTAAEQSLGTRIAGLEADLSRAIAEGETRLTAAHLAKEQDDREHNALVETLQVQATADAAAAADAATAHAAALAGRDDEIARLQQEHQDRLAEAEAAQR